MNTTFRLVAVAGLIAAGSLLGATVGAQATEHCPDHNGHPGKVELTDDSTYSVTLPADTVFCVKAGTGASEVLTSTGEPWEVDWLNPGGQRPAISYYVVYSGPGDGDNGNGDNGDTGNGDNGNGDNGNGDNGNGDNGNGDNGNGNGDNGNGDNGDNGNGNVPTETPETPEPETPEPETGQLPPPGTDESETVRAEIEPVQLPPAPETGVDPPPTATPSAAEPEQTELPETGATLAVTAALGLTLLMLGVGLRRFAG